jgi:aryl-alcohol dehydrogenase-like predicted oxidoreductase
MQYKLLGNTGLRVSELCLGTMGFGTDTGWGIDEKASHEILDAFANAGGNFLDTANKYSNGNSEKIIGNFISNRDRDQFVIATKYALFDNTNHPNASGNSRKNMMRSVEGSLKRLQTDLLDVFYLHIWDHTTPMDEVLRGMDDLVSQGKIIYPAISDTAAWRVSAANTYAQLKGMSSFAALQVEYSLLQRSAEHELVPMAQHYGMTFMPWAPLAGGALTGKYLKGDTGRITEASIRRGEKAQFITKEVMAIADELDTSAGNVALQWTRQQVIECIPILGATKLSQLQDNLGVIQCKLSAEHMQRLNQVSNTPKIFPNTFFEEDAVRQATMGGFYNSIDKRRL